MHVRLFWQPRLHFVTGYNTACGLWNEVGVHHSAPHANVLEDCINTLPARRNSFVASSVYCRRLSVFVVSLHALLSDVRCISSVDPNLRFGFSFFKSLFIVDIHVVFGLLIDFRASSKAIFAGVWSGSHMKCSNHLSLHCRIDYGSWLVTHSY